MMAEEGLRQGGCLRLKAGDAQDLLVLSTCLQDALVAVVDIAHRPEAGRFEMLCNRFLWEAGEPGRIRCALAVDHVTAVRRRGVSPGQTERILSLLAIRPGEDSSSIELAFSGGGAIRLEVSEILCHLQDLGEPWPTSRRPHHEQEP